MIMLQWYRGKRYVCLFMWHTWLNFTEACRTYFLHFLPIWDECAITQSNLFDKCDPCQKHYLKCNTMLLKDIKQTYQTNTHRLFKHIIDVHIIYIIILSSLHFTFVFIFDRTGWDVFLPVKISERLQSIDWILNIIFYFVADFQNRFMSKCNYLHIIRYIPY
jgi:hypothetical protein